MAEPTDGSRRRHRWRPTAIDDEAVEHQPSERRRVFRSAALGVFVAVAIAPFTPWQMAVLAGFMVGAGVLVTWIWVAVGSLDGPSTKRLATREDDSRAASHAVVVLACLASLGGVALGLLKAREIGGATGAVLTIGAILVVAEAWVVVHTMFMLRYAHQFYDDAEGFDFPDDKALTYLDFAYVAFTVGMTFQVSDTEVTTRRMRGLLLRHAALSYVFGTAIIGLTINVLGGLLG